MVASAMVKVTSSSSSDVVYVLLWKNKDAAKKTFKYFKKLANYRFLLPVILNTLLDEWKICLHQIGLSIINHTGDRRNTHKKQ